MKKETLNLQEAIKFVYNEFKGYSKYKEITGSPLKSKLIEKINSNLKQDVKNYDWNDSSFSSLCRSLLYTVGEPYDYKRTLPRVIELFTDSLTGKESDDLFEARSFLLRLNEYSTDLKMNGSELKTLENAGSSALKLILARPLSIICKPWLDDVNIRKEVSYSLENIKSELFDDGLIASRLLEEVLISLNLIGLGKINVVIKGIELTSNVKLNLGLAREISLRGYAESNNVELTEDEQVALKEFEQFLINNSQDVTRDDITQKLLS